MCVVHDLAGSGDGVARVTHRFSLRSDYENIRKVDPQASFFQDQKKQEKLLGGRSVSSPTWKACKLGKTMQLLDVQESAESFQGFENGAGVEI